MVKVIKANLEIVKWMGTVFSNGLTEVYIKDTFKITKKKEKEKYNGQMVYLLRVILLMINKMVKALWLINKVE